MRTTIRLDDQLLAEAKQLAARTNRTLTAVIEDALRQAVSRTSGADRRERVTLPTSGGGGVRPGIDLDDSASLLDVMEGTE
ncbi:MAG: ribbon-helix-helix protein, CopG family [Actinomycetota bacterium]